MDKKRRYYSADPWWFEAIVFFLAGCIIIKRKTKALITAIATKVRERNTSA